MRIYTKSGDLAFRTFDFPDSQPHFILETYEREFNSITIETSLKSPHELFLLMEAVDVLRNHGYSEINLDCRYLLGARMDRALSSMEPYTLQLVARVINSLGFSRVRLLDVHSEVATRLIRNSENVLPKQVVDQVLATLGTGTTGIIIPDRGATERVQKLTNGFYSQQCYKKRNPQTGTLTDFVVPNRVGPNCLIIDDICDGGGTFVGLSKELKKAGATKVNLFVTHGIFSKGLPLEGIDTIYTTDSYQPDTYGFERVVCIPISMREL
jgi:ribose-phosphate pyrophosphokinase